jgi:hypothetical protein
MKKTLFPTLLIFGLISTVSVYADGYAGVTLTSWTDIIPIIDGDMNSYPGEWDDAAFADFQTTNGINGRIYVMNNVTHLFIFITCDEPAGSKKSIRVMFDNDNDRVEWEDMDDAIYFGLHAVGGFKDNHYNMSLGT